MAHSRDPEELKFTWLQWHSVGRNIGKLYPEYIDLNVKMAKAYSKSRLTLYVR